MTLKNTSTIKRHLTPQAQSIAEQLIKKLGSIKMVLSAGVIALNKLTANQREKMIVEANKRVDNIPARDSKDSKKMIEYIKKLSLIEGGFNTKIKVLSAEDAELLRQLRSILGPISRARSRFERNKHKEDCNNAAIG